MPIYEYRCAACGHTLDALQKLNDGPLRKCPECGKSTLKRLMSAPSFRLKGGGWYETDFKSDGEKKRNLVEAAASDPGEAASGGKSDAGKDAAAGKDGVGKDGAGKDGPGKDGAGKEAKAAEKTDGATAGAAKPAAKPKEPAPTKARSAKKRTTRSARPARR